jgi:hypothetical protein
MTRASTNPHNSPSSATGGPLAFANQLVESIVFLRVEPDHVFLDGNFFPGHESPPSLPCRDRDSEIPVMIDDGATSLDFHGPELA